MPTRNLNLTEQDDSFLLECVRTGRYDSTDEAVRAALRLLEKQECYEQQKVEWLRSTTQSAFQALDRGEGMSLSPGQDIDQFVGECVQEARASRAAAHG